MVVSLHLQIGERVNPQRQVFSAMNAYDKYTLCAGLSTMFTLSKGAQFSYLDVFQYRKLLPERALMFLSQPDRKVT